jgi:hypothetical protein
VKGIALVVQPVGGKMDRLTAKDVMTAEVLTVRAETSLEEIAQLLAEHHISGVPVVDEQRHVFGIVSEADLIDEHKREWRIPRTALYGLFPFPEDVLAKAKESVSARQRLGEGCPPRSLLGPGRQVGSPGSGRLVIRCRHHALIRPREVGDEERSAFGQDRRHRDRARL